MSTDSLQLLAHTAPHRAAALLLLTLTACAGDGLTVAVGKPATQAGDASQAATLALSQALSATVANQAAQTVQIGQLIDTVTTQAATWQAVALALAVALVCTLALVCVAVVTVAARARRTPPATWYAVTPPTTLLLDAADTWPECRARVRALLAASNQVARHE